MPTIKRLGTDPETLAADIAQDLRNGPVALGFECPLFVPLHGRAEALLSCRAGEGNRAWSASAGVSSLGTGLVQSAWLLERIRLILGHVAPVFVDIAEFRRADTGLLLWEAFITGARNSTHEQDAIAGAEAFLESWPEVHDCIPCKDVPTMSLIALALIRMHWTEDLSLIGQKPIVVRPREVRK